MDAPTKGQSRLIALIFVAVLAIWTLTMAWSVRAALPYNPIQLPFGESLARFLLPQGWKFFTRNPREEDLFVFSRTSEGTWQSEIIGPNGRPSNLFGIKRDTRAQGIEMGLLTASAKKMNWIECKDLPVACLNIEHPSIIVENSMPVPTICGEIGLVLQEPIPWAWSNAKRPVKMPLKFLKINVICALP